MRKVLYLLVAVVATSTVLAQFEDNEQGTTEVTSDAPDRKYPSFWHRPQYDTPEEQLAYAKDLEDKGKKRRATGEYRALVHAWHESEEAVTAQKGYSRLLDERGKYNRAFEEYQYLIHFYPLRIDYNKVLENQFKVANVVMATRRLTLFVFPGFAAPERALGMFEQLAENAPGWIRAHEVQYNIGWIHEQVKDFQEAADAYAVVLRRYPERDRELTDDAAFRRADCLYQIATRSPRDEVACRNALSALSIYVTRYGSSEKDTDVARERTDVAIDHLQLLKDARAERYITRARFYDRTGHDKAASLAYEDFERKFPGNDDDALVREARARIDALQAETEQDNETNE